MILLVSFSIVKKLTAALLKLLGLSDLRAGSVTPATIAFPPILMALRLRASLLLFMTFPARPLAVTSSDSERINEGWTTRCVLLGSFKAESDFLARGNEAGTSKVAMVSVLATAGGREAAVSMKIRV